MCVCVCAQFSCTVEEMSATAKDDAGAMRLKILTEGFILGRVAEVFDRLGLASPFIVRAKILIQNLWTMDLG